MSHLSADVLVGKEAMLDLLERWRRHMNHATSIAMDMMEAAPLQAAGALQLPQVS
jgi:hypothetical protein